MNFAVAWAASSFFWYSEGLLLTFLRNSFLLDYLPTQSNLEKKGTAAQQIPNKNPSTHFRSIRSSQKKEKKNGHRKHIHQDFPRGHPRTHNHNLGGEVGGWWSAETVSFLCLLAKARARSGMRSRVEKRGASVRASMLACAAAFAASLLEQRVPVGSDGNTLASHEMVAHHPHSCLG